MKKLFFCISLVLTGLMTSCVDKYEEVDAESKPSWLGESIYAELKNPNQEALTGSFNTYLRLVDDLGEAETLNKTGSKTVFPANDEAFERFFKSNEWGVTSYEQLTEAQKKLLLYSSIIDNAMLVSMLSNTSGSDGIVRGFAMKHQTAINAIDTISHFYNASEMPENNKYWEKYYEKGIDVVCDNTTPMMIHLTREYMVNNSITTVGQGSDFEIITGQPYTDGAAYIFNDRIITKGEYSDGKTCQNGYIHQVENVLMPPGNLAQEIASDKETSLYSRMIEYFSAPYFDRGTTNAYNASAIQYGKPIIDSIFQKRYFSDNSQKEQLQYDPDGLLVEATLKFDPGWNTYQMKQAAGISADNSIADIAAMFVPVNSAVEEYFLPGGAGSYFMDIYGEAPNTQENLRSNIDALWQKRPDVISKIIRNLQNVSFSSSVPSKFPTLNSDGGEFLGLTLSDLQKKNGQESSYDVKFANNGIIYKLNRVIAPDEFSSVFAPASFYPDLQVMRYMVEQPSSGAGCDFIYYLLAMQANYAFMIPEDNAFSEYMYVDPATLGKVEPEAIKFTYVYDPVNKNYKFKAERYKYDIKTNQPGAFVSEISNVTALKSQINDILNYHTVVLEAGETFGTNNYYKTKNGGAIKLVGKVEEGNQIVSGAQIDNGQAPSVIGDVIQETNGVAIRLDHVLEAPRNSVYKMLSDVHKDRFAKFFEICEYLDGAGDMMTWLGISDVPNDFGVSEQDQYTIFTSTYGTGSNAIADACLDMNVKMFNTYNYTLLVPSNDAMDAAYANGLPHITDMDALYSASIEKDDDDPTIEEDKSLLRNQLLTLRNFVRYHFHNVSVYADNVVNSGREERYNTMYMTQEGVPYSIYVSGGSGKLNIKDGHGTVHVVDANNTGRLSNIMARDYWFNGEKTMRASEIKTSSFCVIHELSEAMNWQTDDTRFDKKWRTSAAKARSLDEYKRLKAKNQL